MRRPQTRELYDAALASFRENPGNYAVAARAANCEWRCARRLWELGWPRYTWAPPIKEKIKQEQEEARLLVAKRAQEEREKADQLREAARQAAIESRANEARVIQAARGNAAATLAVTAELLRGAITLARQVKATLEDPTKSAALAADPEKAARTIALISRAGREAVQSASAVQEMERLHLGKPTEILGLTSPDGSELSLEEALAEIQAATRAGERFAGRLQVIEGGKSDAAAGSPPGTASAQQ